MRESAVTVELYPAVSTLDTPEYDVIMKALITADLHLSDNPRDSYRFEFLSSLTDIAKDLAVDRVLILGDLTEEKDRHSAWLVNEICDYLHELSDVCEIVILKGNHDYIVASLPYYRFLRYMDKVRWINNPTDRVRGVPNSLFLPHTTNYERDWSGYEFEKYDWIFAHNTFKGAVVEGGRKLDGIPTAVFPKGCKIISGDIHVPQKLNRITYVGAPYTIDFGDSYTSRLLLLNNGNLEEIELTGPQKKLVNISSVADLKRQKNLNKGDILKIQVQIPQSDHDKWPEIKQQVRTWGDQNDFVVHIVKPVIDRKTKTQSKRKISTVTSDETLLREYAKLHKLKRGTLNAGLRLMRQV